ncbi:MAG TPA: glycerol-3-phosphate dehydrogenase C-terminal domain-containing protein [Candidatus Dormibacteraeota bacterium]
MTEADAAQVLSEASLALEPDLIRSSAVRFSFAGLRVLPIGEGSTAGARRGHMVRVGSRGMVSIAGGKLTTHRRIALAVLARISDPRLAKLGRVEDALPEASDHPGVLARDVDPPVASHLFEIYGSDAVNVLAQRPLHSNAMERIHPDGPDIWAQAYHAVDREWALTVDDVVRRRTTLAVRGLATPSLRSRIQQATSVIA